MTSSNGRLVWLPEHRQAMLSDWFQAELDGSFKCPLPGHGGRSFLDWPREDTKGDLRLLCCCGRWRSLGAMRAAASYGVDENPRRPWTNIELATWSRRLAFDLGALRPLDVPLGRVPDVQPGGLVAAGFALLAGLRWVDGPRRALPWSVRFAAAWCGVSHRQANLGIAAMLQAGSIREVECRGRVRYFLPGAVLAGGSR